MPGFQITYQSLKINMKAKIYSTKICPYCVRAKMLLEKRNIKYIEYKVDDFWSQENERSLIWDDELININWPLKKINKKNPNLSKKDLLGATIRTLQKSNEIFK